jgi:outer membrane protein OmpA-like peptidoglycan-associated protein
VSRSPERSRLAVLVALLTALVVGAPPAWAEPAPPPADAAGEVQDVVGEVESLDGTERQSQAGQTVTVELAGDVLFALDRADLSPAAQDRLQRVAGQIAAGSAAGAIRVHGHTDDQGSDAYNDDLSRRRAEAVRAELARLITGAGATIEAIGHGERQPRVPNIVDGRPDERNRAENRRVEIVYDVRR